MKRVESETMTSLGLICNDGVILANRIEILHGTIKLPSPTFNLIHAIEENVFMVKYLKITQQFLCNE